RVRGSRIRLVVRTGDPRMETTLARVSAEYARAVIVLPPASLDDDSSVQWTLAVLLAMRRIADAGFKGQVIVEARHMEARELLGLVGEPGIAGAAALATEVVASDDVVARILAQSVRQEGVYFAIREMLAFDGCEVYLDPCPAAVVGKPFEEAHGSIDGAVL